MTQVLTDPYQRFAEFIEPFVKGQTGYIGLMCAKRINVTVDRPNGDMTGIENFYLPVTNGEVEMTRGLLDDDQDFEWFFTPAIIRDRSRTQSMYKSANVVWVDLDGSLNLDGLPVPPSLVVRTSPDRFHLYWVVNEAIASVHDQVYWNSRMLHSIDGDDADVSGKDATQLLRLPVGRNFKNYGEGEPFVPVLWKMSDITYDERDFEHLPEPPAFDVVESDEAVLADIPILERTWSEYLVSFGSKIPDPLKIKLLSTQESEDHKRSGGMWSLYHELKVYLNRTEIFQVLRGSPNDKWANQARGSAKLWRDIVRSIDKIDVNKESYTADIREIMSGPESIGDKKQRVSHYVMGKLNDTGKFMRTEADVFYYVDERTEIPQLWEISDKLVSDFAAYINKRFGIDPGLEKALLMSILHKAGYIAKEAPKTEFYHMSHYNVESNTVYLDRFDGTMYVLDGETVTTKPQGYRNIFFYRDTSDMYPISFEYKKNHRKGGLDALLYSGPNYLPVDQGTTSEKLYMHALRTWVLTLFFPEIMPTKAMAVFIGEADSGKSTFFQTLSLILTGRETRHVQDIPTDAREFNVIVSSTPWCCFDNVEVNHKWAQEKLAQVATGFVAKTREMYTNRGVVSLRARAFVGITSRTMAKIQRDVAQRYIVIPVTPFNQMDGDFKRRALGEIFQEIRNNRDDLMSELMDYVNRVIIKLGEEPGLAGYETDLRMADYGKMLALTCGLEGLSFDVAEDFIKKMQTYTMGENDPIFLALRAVAKDYPSQSFFRAKKLWELCLQYAPNKEFRLKYKNSVVFSRSLKGYANGGQLRYYGLDITTSRSGNAHKYRLNLLDNTKPLDEIFAEGEGEDDD